MKGWMKLPSQYISTLCATSFHKSVRLTFCLHRRIGSLKMLTKQPLFALTWRRSVHTVRLELYSKQDTDLGNCSDSYWSSCHSRDLRIFPSGVSLCEICGGQKRMERVFPPSISVLHYEHNFSSDQYTYLALYCFYQKEFWWTCES